MKNLIVTTFLVSLAALLIPPPFGVRALGHQATQGHVKLRRENPDGWFTLLVPSGMGKVERHADVDGGFYRMEEFEVDYDYWAYENTPNFLRTAGGSYPKGPLLACSSKARHPRNSWTRIDGRRALIQTCSDSDEWRGSFHVYYVTFPKLKVYDGAGVRNGMLNLTIRYKNRRYLSAAERIVHSLDFK
ncbi:MAG TPA: hypothetical protein VK421_15815 [Pyrinomonadaceae bacterium]|nr:hypothetical protein [Pyrinomonadaceae bacterium]